MLRNFAQTEALILGFDVRGRQRRHLFCDLDVPASLDVALGENDIDLLQRPTSSLRVKHVDDRNEADVQTSEKKERSPRDRRQKRRCRHHNREIEQPIVNSRNCIGVGARGERVDLRRVQPRELQPC